MNSLDYAAWYDEGRGQQWRPEEAVPMRYDLHTHRRYGIGRKVKRIGLKPNIVNDKEKEESCTFYYAQRVYDKDMGYATETLLGLESFSEKEEEGTSFKHSSKQMSDGRFLSQRLTRYTRKLSLSAIRKTVCHIRFKVAEFHQQLQYNWDVFRARNQHMLRLPRLKLRG